MWCTNRRKDVTTIIGPLLRLPDFPHLDLPRPQITAGHPTLLLHTDPYVGLQSAHLVTVREWASLQEVATGSPEAVQRQAPTSTRHGKNQGPDSEEPDPI